MRALLALKGEAQQVHATHAEGGERAFRRLARGGLLRPTHPPSPWWHRCRTQAEMGTLRRQLAQQRQATEAAEARAEAAMQHMHSLELKYQMQVGWCSTHKRRQRPCDRPRRLRNDTLACCLPARC
jgi:hypothetical protein